MTPSARSRSSSGGTAQLGRSSRPLNWTTPTCSRTCHAHPSQIALPLVTAMIRWRPTGMAPAGRSRRFASETRKGGQTSSRACPVRRNPRARQLDGTTSVSAPTSMKATSPCRYWGSAHAGVGPCDAIPTSSAHAEVTTAAAVALTPFRARRRRNAQPSVPMFTDGMDTGGRCSRRPTAPINSMGSCARHATPARPSARGCTRGTAVAGRRSGLPDPPVPSMPDSPMSPARHLPPASRSGAMRLLADEATCGSSQPIARVARETI